MTAAVDILIVWLALKTMQAESDCHRKQVRSGHDKTGGVDTEWIVNRDDLVLHQGVGSMGGEEEPRDPSTGSQSSFVILGAAQCSAVWCGAVRCS